MTTKKRKTIVRRATPQLLDRQPLYKTSLPDVRVVLHDGWIVAAIELRLSGRKFGGVVRGLWRAE